MKKKRDQPPQTKMQILMTHVDTLEVILHPRVIGSFKQAVWDARTEMAQAAKDQVISKELQALEPLLERFRENIKLYSSGGATPNFLWQMRPLFKKIIELYGIPAENIPQNQ